jgi:anaerobic selenocysteine-containing dehydrogenase
LPEPWHKPLRELDLLVMADRFMPPTAEAAHIFLPLCSVVETEGTFTNHERRVQQVRQAILPRNGLENWQLLCQIAGRISSRFRMKYNSAAEIGEEIRRLVPLYPGLNLEGGLDESVWNMSQFPLQPISPSRTALLPGGDIAPRQPRATVDFDHLELRLEQRWKTLFDRARQALHPVEPITVEFRPRTVVVT